jgi:hypothetical protein
MKQRLFEHLQWHVTFICFQSRRMPEELPLQIWKLEGLAMAWSSQMPQLAVLLYH